MADIEFNHVSKRYIGPRSQPAALGNERGRSFWQRLRQNFQPKPAFWALRDVTFSVERGEAVAIIGHNGAGKSTVLKLLSSITAPTSGEVILRRKLSALVEVSAGFHPELTGRENVYLTGVILGMTRREVSQKLPQIVDFSGIGDFLDMPVKRYSSGMSVRLGFAIAAHLDAEMLLLDEVLAVGDVAFQWKCLDRIEQLRKEGRTILFVSHDLAAVERLCDRAILLERGQICLEGTPRDVITEYQRSTLLNADPPEYAHRVSDVLDCTAFSYYGPAGASEVRTGDAMTVRIDFHARQRLESVVFHVYIYWPSGYLCTELSTGPDGAAINAGAGYVEFRCPFVNLRPGLYMVDVSADRGAEVLDWRHRCATLRVDNGPAVLGDFHLPHRTVLFESGRSPRELGEAGFDADERRIVLVDDGQISIV